MRTQPETRARSSQEAGKRALNLWGPKANQACSPACGQLNYLTLIFILVKSPSTVGDSGE
eukprot:scaffold80752_cov36-Phaeocystis_antarctica.AAC.2